ncbi:hypothetical protein CFK37_02435 [Virgibacillus phasianinus]|uniref:Lipoprotein n=1 Tax=Virgibacillus phasianinus TaxID=2017483 RepID=A0A220TZC3_9BACI|nr:hypothetical protein [Virgibacillus phasianinus]ASK61130.1 hypothetical protein CFK37_02435 [Virgibacillus phasianinus]
MRKILYLMLLTTLLLMTAACSSGDEEKSNEGQNGPNMEDSEGGAPEEDTTQSDETDTTDLTDGVDQVLVSLDELKTVITKSPDDNEKIKNTGIKVGEKWDEIEKMVEEKYPEDYENIEESLYPLKAEVKKDKLNMERINQLTSDTEKKVKEFKQKL